MIGNEPAPDRVDIDMPPPDPACAQRVSGPPGPVPAWLDRFRQFAPSMPVPPLLRPPASGARSAAVLVLFGEGPDGPDLLLIERAAHLSKHAGQPAFPGGGLEPGDDGPVAAAVRETWEETGLDPVGVEVLAVLPELHLARSGYRVTPVAGWWRDPRGEFTHDPGEVAFCAWVPIAELVDPANRLTVRHSRAGYAGPAFKVGGMLVWGFTAGLITRLLDAGGWARPWDTGRIEDLPQDVLDRAARG